MPDSDSSLSDPSTSNALRGISYCVGALLLFACIDTATKYLAAYYVAPMLIWVRFGVHLLCMTVLLLPRERARLLHAQRPALVILRALVLIAVSLLMILSLRRMPLAEVTSVQFLAPLLVTLLAGPLLGEKIGWVRTVCVLAGFMGVLLIVRPGNNVDPLGLVFVFLAALGNAGYQMLSRLLGGTERPVVMLYYSALVGFVCMSLVMPWYWHEAWPAGFDLLLLISLGVAGGVGHLLFTFAYRDAPASTLAPITYLQLFWAGLLGWMVFGYIPTGLTLLGMLIIACSGAAVAMYDHFKKTQ